MGRPCVATSLSTGRRGVARRENPRPQIGVGSGRSYEHRRKEWSPSREGNEAWGVGREGIGALHSTGEAGEGGRPDPVEGRGCLVAEPLGGNRPRALSLDLLSTELQRITQRHVNPWRDEPYALIGQVRICGSLGGQPPRRPGGFVLRNWSSSSLSEKNPVFPPLSPACLSPLVREVKEPLTLPVRRRFRLPHGSKTW